MIRQYKIHTDLDGMNDKVWDVTNGKVRLYQPSDLGIEVSNNLWGSDGIGVMGERSISQPDIKFTLITLGASVKENYKLINEFVNDILSVKYVTLEYQTELFQVFADVALSKVTKTEGYGFNGTFEEEITFNMITKWYTYERLEFSTIENGEIIDGISKIYGGSKDKMKLPNYNMEQHTRQLIGTDNKLIWGTFATNTKTIAYEEVSIMGLPMVTSGVAFTQVSTGQSGWRSPNGAGGGSYPVIAGEKYTISAYIKNNADTDMQINLSMGLSATEDQASPTRPTNYKTVKANTDYTLYTTTLTIPEGMNYGFTYVYTISGTPSADWAFAGLKVEKGDKRTLYLPTENEMTNADYAPYAGYRYIKDVAYTYYGETDVQRLSRWKIDEPFFSFTAKLTPSATIDATKQIGLKFLNENLNEYSAILFTIDQRPDYIMINTDVNDEFYLATTGATTINAFPTLDMQRYRTRIFTKGQMTMQNLSSVEIKVKRKVDFI